MKGIKQKITILEKVIGIALRVRSDLRASRNEIRAEQRETRAKQIHEKKYFGRTIKQLGTEEKENA